jgi:antitoxin component YwqK of YwqJK toxin-antitoxin module
MQRLATERNWRHGKYDSVEPWKADIESTMGISYSKWVGDIWIQVEDGVVRRNLPKRNGTARSWHENGELAQEYELVEGVVVGEMRA